MSKSNKAHWDYGKVVVKNPVLEGDRKLLQRLCNPKNCFDQDSVSFADTATMYSSSSADSVTVGSTDSVGSVDQAERDRAEAEALAEQLLNCCHPNMLGDDETVDSRAAAIRADGSYIFSIDKKQTTDEGSVRKSKSAEVVMRSDTMETGTTRSSISGQSGKGVERSLLDGASFDTEEGCRFDGNKKDEVTLFMKMLSGGSISGSFRSFARSERELEIKPSSSSIQGPRKYSDVVRNPSREMALEMQKSSSTIQGERGETIRHVKLSESTESSHANIDFLNKLVDDEVVDVGGNEDEEVTIERSFSLGSGEQLGKYDDQRFLSERGNDTQKRKSWFSRRKKGHSNSSKNGQEGSSVAKRLRSSCRRMFRVVAN